MNVKKVLFLFIGWRMLLFLFLFLSIQKLQLQQYFIGGGMSAYVKNPYLWSWINFDGEHYLSIARDGYMPLTYFYFPLYPLFVRLVANILGGTFRIYAITGLVISHIAFFIGIIGLIKLTRLDYSIKITKQLIILLLLFPTSFYFISYYTEGLFFALVIWAFYFARKNIWVLAGILGGLSSATRVLGIALFPALIAEYFIAKRSLRIGRDFINLLLIPIGLLIYMLFLKIRTGDALEFFNNVGIFGQQRSANLIILPQVFYRYIFKILPNVNYNYFPAVFSTWMELIVGIIFAITVIWAIIISLNKIKGTKMHLGYTIFLIMGYLIPPLSGSFSSLPRYVLILFPGFMLISVFLLTLPRIIRTGTLIISGLSLAIATVFFSRGYWVA
ncbi:hypothetical protein A2159_03040 [Candidatus Woesebacteria bacterium RBG_13_34_9]|uniref:Glycosyltransferase RgtA/B/C/D-like domain-containing protein n=1 Tax=Candidatus Woesebacteria bacterium RBG_13_34_9 TaxID=1802477 RepID=A0A1F7X0H8_9BACT|nr:MAG: hypothetical protein A2159_03040 [Candidatus Woesebacteria bacterium RBG_13_34_9]